MDKRCRDYEINGAEGDHATRFPTQLNCPNGYSSSEGEGSRVEEAAAIMALRTANTSSDLDPLSTRSSTDLAAERERNRMHAKNTRERKKLKLNKLEELANQLEREIEELNHRSMHHDWGSALMVPSQHNTGVGASPAITELQARAGKLAMRVAAQDTMLAQLKQENAVLMAHIQAASHRARKLGSEQAQGMRCGFPSELGLLSSNFEQMAEPTGSRSVFLPESFP